MRERPNRTVSKTVVAQVTVGSNPTPSAPADLGAPCEAPGQRPFSAPARDCLRLTEADRHCPKCALLWGADGVRGKMGVRKGCETRPKIGSSAPAPSSRCVTRTRCLRGDMAPFPSYAFVGQRFGIRRSRTRRAGRRSAGGNQVPFGVGARGSAAGGDRVGGGRGMRIVEVWRKSPAFRRDQDNGGGHVQGFRAKRRLRDRQAGSSGARQHRRNCRSGPPPV
jgi:hypothetical protein